MAKVLVIDDDRSVRHIVARGLDGHQGLQVLSSEDGDAGLELLRTEQPDVALLDVFLPEYNGLELFRKMRAIDHKIPVIFITGDTSSDTAIEAMRAGAFDYLAKPLNIGQLRDLTLSAVQNRRMMDEPVALMVGSSEEQGEHFVGSAKRMIEVYKDIGRVAAQNVTVLIRGESGSGKELVARAIVDHSDRSDRPFVAVNCAAIPDQLLESELFGHERGAFTGAEKRRIGRFEQCDGGTIFLDEVGDMSPATQGKVLRVLQDQTFERVGGSELIKTGVRVIAATNRPLEHLVENDEFREDLLYRLNGFTIFLPPLRERREDIPALLEYFLRRAKSEMGREQLEGIAPDALEILIAYDWPGNVRQLQSVVRQSLLNTTGTVLSAASLPGFVTGTSPHSAASGASEPAANDKSASMAISAGDAGPTGSDADVAISSQEVEPAVATARSPSPSSSDHAVVLSVIGVENSKASYSPLNVKSGKPPAKEATADASALPSESSDVSTLPDSAIPRRAVSHSPDGSPLLVESDREANSDADEAFLIAEFIEQRLREGSKDLYAEALEQMERRIFARVLNATNGNQSKAAEILGVTRGKVRDRIAAYNIQLDRTVSMGH